MGRPADQALHRRCTGWCRRRVQRPSSGGCARKPLPQGGDRSHRFVGAAGGCHRGQKATALDRGRLEAALGIDRPVHGFSRSTNPPYAVLVFPPMPQPGTRGNSRVGEGLAQPTHLMEHADLAPHIVGTAVSGIPTVTVAGKSRSRRGARCAGTGSSSRSSPRAVRLRRVVQPSVSRRSVSDSRMGARGASHRGAARGRARVDVELLCHSTHQGILQDQIGDGLACQRVTGEHFFAHRERTPA